MKKLVLRLRALVLLTVGLAMSLIRLL